jgi:hypothetical protein
LLLGLSFRNREANSKHAPIELDERIAVDREAKGTGIARAKGPRGVSA